jgi:hypothetical protein
MVRHPVPVAPLKVTVISVCPDGHPVTNIFGLLAAAEARAPVVSNPIVVKVPIRIMFLHPQSRETTSFLNKELTFGVQEVLVQFRIFLILKGCI